MEKKRMIGIAISIALIIVIVITGIVLLAYYMPWPNKKTPAITFAYHDKANDIYLIDSKGFVYFIDRSSDKTNYLAWAQEAVQALENEESTEWLEQVGKVDVNTLQKKYNLFCKIMDNPNFRIYATVHEVPAVEPNTQYTTPQEYWYGYYQSGEKREMRELFLVGYLQYEASDRRAREIADWITKVTMPYKKKR